MSTEQNINILHRYKEEPETRLCLDIEQECIDINHNGCCAYTFFYVQPGFKEYWAIKNENKAVSLVSFSKKITNEELKYFNESCLQLCDICKKIRRSR